jgi:VWFA-related protein
MKRLAIAMLSVVALAGAAKLSFAQERQARPGFVAEARVNNVSVDVKVVGTKGLPVAGLRKEDFRIAEDGKDQVITNFMAVTGGEVSASGDAAAIGQPANRQILIFFDLYQMIDADKTLVLKSLKEQFSPGFAPGTTVAVVSFDGRLHVHTPASASRERVLEALKEVERLPATGLQRQLRLSTYRGGRASPYESQSRFEYRRAMNEEYWMEMRRCVGAVTSALAAALDRFAGADARKILVFVSPGFPRAENVPIYGPYDFFFGSPADGYRNVGLYTQAARLASELAYTMYTIDPSANSLTNFTDAGQPYVPGFTDVADARFWREADRKDNLIHASQLTGGEAMFTSDGAGALADVERVTSSYYSLAFQPNHFGDGKSHTIKVVVQGHPEYALTHRREYVDRPGEQRDAERAQAALLAGDASNPLGIELVLDKPTGRFKFGARGMKLYRIGAELHIPYAKLTMVPRGASHWGQVQVAVVATDSSGNLSDLHHQRVPIEIQSERLAEARQRGYFTFRFTLEVEGGSTSVRVGVDDVLAQTTSAVTADLKL